MWVCSHDNKGDTECVRTVLIRPASTCRAVHTPHSITGLGYEGMLCVWTEAP